MDKTQRRKAQHRQQKLYPKAYRAAAKAAYAQRYLKRAAWLARIKMASGCVDCGYNTNPIPLEFDHLPERGKKRFTITHQIANYSLAILKAEIAKCEVVCANCHKIRTAKRRKGDAVSPAVMTPPDDDNQREAGDTPEEYSSAWEEYIEEDGTE